MAYHDSKQYLGMQDARVWSEGAVRRAHPMAFFCISLTLLWYGRCGQGQAEVRRERPWYQAAGVTFTAALGQLRLAIWKKRVFEETGEQTPLHHLLENLLHALAAVR